MKNGLSFDAPGFGREAEESWGVLHTENAAPEPVETEVGDYRGIYANVRDALLDQRKPSSTGSASKTACCSLHTPVRKRSG